MERVGVVKPDFWWMLGLFLFFIVLSAGAMLWAGYLPVAYVFIISGIVGSAVMAYFFRPDSASRR